MKTEQEAWLALAEIWKGAVANPEGGKALVTMRDGCTCLGLCTTLDWMLWNEEEISDSTKTDMEAKINAKVRFSWEQVDSASEHFPYLFPLTLDGAKQRVQYCLDRAAELRS